MIDLHAIFTVVVVVAMAQGVIYTGIEDDIGDLIMPSYGTILRKHSLIISGYYMLNIHIIILYPSLNIFYISCRQLRMNITCFLPIMITSKQLNQL